MSLLRSSNSQPSRVSFSQLTIVALACFIAITATSTAKASIVLVSQQRSISAIAIDQGQQQQQTAPDFGPFNMNVSVPGGGASQDSTLTVAPDGSGAELFATLTAAASAITPPGPASGDSIFTVTFDITRTGSLPFTLTYSSTLNPGDGIGAAGSFTGGSAPGALPNGDSTSGSLMPGQYILHAEENSNGGIMLDVHIGTAIPIPSSFWAAVASLPVLPLIAKRMIKPSRCGG